MTKKTDWRDEECAFCSNMVRIRFSDLQEAESITYALCKDCFKSMAKQWRKTKGLWGPSYDP